jgi:hypothetical protein
LAVRRTAQQAAGPYTDTTPERFTIVTKLTATGLVLRPLNVGMVSAQARRL